jgi:hypothetical protein
LRPAAAAFVAEVESFIENLTIEEIPRIFLKSKNSRPPTGGSKMRSLALNILTISRCCCQRSCLVTKVVALLALREAILH